MVRKSTAITVLGQDEAALEASKYIPREDLQQLSFWGKLNKREQESLVYESNQLTGVMIINASSNLAIGERLRRLHDLLSSHKGAFEKFIRRFHKSRTSAFRHIREYEKALERVQGQEHILHAAMAMGMNLPGKWEEAMLKCPPPRNLTEDGATRYLEQVKKTRKDIIQGRKEGTIEPVEIVKKQKRSTTALLMMSYRAVRYALQVVPKKQHQGFIESLVGMILTERGISGAATFTPEAVPDDFKPNKKGRPKGSRNRIQEDVKE